jgi:hypothetical protein
MQNIALSAFNKLKSKFISESTQYSGASKMGKGSALKGVEVKADFEKFESYFYTDSVIFGIVNTIADSMSEAGINFSHSEPDLALQANDVASSFDFDSHIAGLTRSNMVFGNSFSILEETEGYQFLDILNPKNISAQVKKNRHTGWENKSGEEKSEFSFEQLLHIPTNSLAGSTWGTSPLQPLTRILDLKENVEINLNKLVVRYLVPRYVYLLGKKGASVPQEIINEFAKSLADPAAAQDQVFENKLEILTQGTQYKALHVGYILDYAVKSIYAGLAFPDTFYFGKGSTEATAKIQIEIFNKKRIGGLQKTYYSPILRILEAAFRHEGIKTDTLPTPGWGPLSSASLEAKVEHIISLAKLSDSEDRRILSQAEIRKILKNELGFDLSDSDIPDDGNGKQGKKNRGNPGNNQEMKA